MEDKYYTTRTVLKDGILEHKIVNSGLSKKDVLISLDAYKKEVVSKSENFNNRLEEKRKIILRHSKCPGDIIPLTCLVRDIKKQYKDAIDIMVDTPQCPEIWFNNPYVTQFEWDDSTDIVGCDYGDFGSSKSNSWQYHFYHAFRLDFERKTGLKVTPTICWPELYLTEKEKNKKIVDADNYWLIWPGNKIDCKIKSWPIDNWKRIVVEFSDITFVQVGQSKHGHKLIQADNVIDARDRTEDYRDLFSLMYNASGSIGYISMQCHLAACFKKPCIVLAGGREPPSFIKYNNQTVLSTIGSMGCREENGCWAGKIGGKAYKFTEVEDICPRPMAGVPLCMWLITPQMVMESLNVYLKGRRYAPKGECDYIAFKKLQQIIADGGIEYVVADEERKNITLKYKDKKNKDKEFTFDYKDYKYLLDKRKISVIEKEIKPINDGNKSKDSIMGVKPVLRLVTNTTYMGGGERTAYNIINLMLEEGYRVEVIPSYRGSPCKEFMELVYKGVLFKEWNKKNITDPCDIFMVHCNDLIWDFSGFRYDDFKDVQARRKVLSINFAIGEIGKAEWTRNYDVYICQSADLACKMQNKVHGANIIRLSPPANLQRFYNRDYSDRRYNQLRLIRHSSQGNRKYYNAIDAQVNEVLSVKDCRILFMPPPTYLNDWPRVQKFRRNAMPVEDFLSMGNVFWYHVDPRKWRCVGENVVLEAMASGLPVLCNDNYGLNEIVNDEVGWICHDWFTMVGIIKDMNIEEAKKKGAKAREYAKKKFDPQQWVRAITGKVAEGGVIPIKECKELTIIHNDVVVKKEITDKGEIKDFVKNKIVPELDHYISETTESNKQSEIKDPKVSIIMPTYQRYDLIHRALESVTMQESQDWELIVINDGIEDDKKRGIIERFKTANNFRDKIKYVEVRHRGCWGNYIFKDAMDYCHGEFMFFLDDDDEISSLLVKEMPDSDYDMIWHRVRFMRDDVLWGIKDEDFARQHIGRPSIMIKTEFMKKARDFMEIQVRNKSLDVRTWTYLKNNHNPKIKRVNKCYAIAHKNGSMNTDGNKGFDVNCINEKLQRIPRRQITNVEARM